VLTVVSGGQTGVDRAALDAARAIGLPTGGWCPRGRLAEDGVVPSEYPLRETPREDYAERTEWNVRDADATLVLTRGRPSPGTALTIDLARRLERRLLTLDLRDRPDPAAVAAFVREGEIAVLNVAGPRESQSPGIGQEARAFLERAFLIVTSTRA
jgi:hypothetical protein